MTVASAHIEKRCPTCGRPVASIFDHLGDDCETWPEDWTMADLKVPDRVPADIPRTKEEAG